MAMAQPIGGNMQLIIKFNFSLVPVTVLINYKNTAYITGVYVV